MATFTPPRQTGKFGSAEFLDRLLREQSGGNPMSESEEICQRIRQARAKTGMTREDTAAAGRDVAGLPEL